MIIPRMISTVLRIAQAICAAIVLGISAHILSLDIKIYNNAVHYSTQHPLAVFGILIYAIVIAAISLVLALIWIVPTTGSIIHWGVDFFFALAWLLVFVVMLMHWQGDGTCDSQDGRWVTGCSEWAAAEGMTFISMGLWAVSAVVGMLVWMHVRKEKRGAGVVAAETGETPVAGRRRWYRRSQV